MGTPLRVLMIEDSAADAELLVRELRRGGYEPTQRRVQTASELLEALADEWDLAISDYALPSFSAPEALKAVRSKTQDLPFIVVSGTIGEDRAVDLLKAGAQDFIAKENLARLLPAIERELREASERRARRDAEQALRLAEEQLRQLAENIGEVLFVASPGGKAIHYISPSYEKVWGRTCEELYRNPLAWMEAIHPEDLPEVRRAVQASPKGVQLEFRIIRSDGSTRWIQSKTYPVRNDSGEILRLAGIAGDITDRKTADQNILLLATALEAAANSIVITDRDGVISWVNPAFVSTSGFAMEEVAGKNPRLLKSGQHEQTFYTALWETILSGRIWRGEIVNRRKDGSLFTVCQTITPVVGDTGAITHFISVAEDITARQSLEAQLRQAQKMEAIGQLAGGIAHDFNNLLTVINGRSQIMLGRLKPDDPARSEFALILNTGERAAALTRQLLAFSRKQVFETKILDLNALVANLDKLLHRLVREDIQIKTVLDPDLQTVKADPGQLEQVLMNLTVNARDAMPEGGRLTIETKNADLDESYLEAHPEARSGPHVMLAVSDTGSGMDEQVKARIFEPFFTTKELGQGTGLGLATVYGIVKQSGGNIEVYSEPGHGSTFKIYLPAAAGEPSAANSAAALPAVRKGSEVLLLVEDEEAVRDLAREVLEMNGYTVLTAGNGTEALQVCEALTGPLDLMISDVVMPVMGGPELAKQLSRLRPRLKVLFVSGYTDQAIVHNGTLKAGAHFLQKPFTPNGLARKVREVLDGQ